MAQHYRIETQQYNEAFSDLESNCNELTFVNKGQAVYLNGVKMDNGDAIMIGGNAGEFCTTKFACVPSTPGAIEVYVIKKIYQ